MAIKKSAKRTPAQSKRPKASPPDVTAIIAAADGSLFSKALERIPDQAAAYIKAAGGELPEEEAERLWREYAGLCGRVCSRGRLWSKEYVMLLVRAFLVMDAEDAEAVRVKAAHDASGEDKRLVRRITSPVNSPPIEGADLLARVLKTTPDDVRRAAGFLPRSQQPSGPAA